MHFASYDMFSLWNVYSSSVSNHPNWFNKSVCHRQDTFGVLLSATTANWYGAIDNSLQDIKDLTHNDVCAWLLGNG